MVLLESSWIDFGNLAIGIGTFTLAIVLGFVSYKNSLRDRAVHIADKRRDWMIEFRLLISELQGLYSELITGVSASEERSKDRARLQILILSRKLRLMFPRNHSQVQRLLEQIDLTSNALSGTKREPRDAANGREQIMKISSEILENQRQKIANLDSTNPLI